MQRCPVFNTLHTIFLLSHAQLFKVYDIETTIKYNMYSALHKIFTCLESAKFLILPALEGFIGIGFGHHSHNRLPFYIFDKFVSLLCNETHLSKHKEL